MALVNVKKKIEKSADKLGLRPGETVIAGCTTNPSGTMKKMLARELGGALASSLAGGVNVCIAKLLLRDDSAETVVLWLAVLMSVMSAVPAT